jgi:hypothetical protein
MAEPSPPAAAGPAAFSAFIDRLSPEARTSLLSSIPMLIAAVVGADRVFTGPDHVDENTGPLGLLAMMFGLSSEENEMSAAATALSDASTELGEAFRRSPEAQPVFYHLAPPARAGGPENFDERLSYLGEIVSAMPPDLATQYRAFVAKMCVSLAMASGGGLFTNPISEVEATVIRKIILNLQLTITDKVERLLLGLEVDEDDEDA